LAARPCHRGALIRRGGKSGPRRQRCRRSWGMTEARRRCGTIAPPGARAPRPPPPPPISGPPAARARHPAHRQRWRGPDRAAREHRALVRKGRLGDRSLLQGRGRRPRRRRFLRHRRPRDARSTNAIW
jgi:hypothetical protein